ncbi:hypothetical protein GGF46_001549 [Coemansia sp. RSA 552]|nr:hypothetical protein GGF46_001549 [Coemansia sp. RSA 552]
MRLKKSIIPGALQRESKQRGSGVIYTQASDFVHPEHFDKDAISRPVSARPMGDIDVTANDGVCSSSAPSPQELHALEQHARQTAHALKTRRKRILRDIIDDKASPAV